MDFLSLLLLIPVMQQAASAFGNLHRAFQGQLRTVKDAKARLAATVFGTAKVVITEVRSPCFASSWVVFLIWNVSLVEPRTTKSAGMLGVREAHARAGRPHPGPEHCCRAAMADGKPPRAS